MGKLGTRGLGLVVAAIAFIVDQAAKAGVISFMGLENEGTMFDVLPIFRLTMTHNNGVALGLFPADSTSATATLTAILAVITTAVAVWLWQEKVRGDALALGLVLGGAVGNLLDRIRHGFVVDFADLHFGEFRPFLIFNIADAAITIGVLLLLARSLLAWWGERQKDAK